nr:hypothetical protein [Rhodococcus sp. SBT000017]
MKQHSAGCLVDVLRARNELSADGCQLKVDLDVVNSIASQAIDLVHDDVLNFVRLDVVEHFLQFRAIG